MHGLGHGHNDASLGQRSYLAIVLLICSVLLFVGACKRKIPFNPDKTYAEAWTHLKRGELADAVLQADEGLSHFSSPDSDWYYRFRLLKAEIFVAQRLTAEAINLIPDHLPPSLADSDLSVWIFLTPAMAHCYQQEFDAAEKLLAQAHSVAEARHPDLLGEVELRDGTLAFRRGDMPLAKTHYAKALQLARQLPNQFLEAPALGSLALVATRDERYDESISWNRAALGVSRAIGQRGSVSYILGNMGWSYFEIGNYERALELLAEAEQSAVQLGSPGAQVDWLSNMAGAYAYLHDYDTSIDSSQKALKIARELDDETLITPALNSLAEVALVRNQIDDAEKKTAEALVKSRAAHDRSNELSSMLIQARILMAHRQFPEAERLLLEVIGDQSPDNRVSLRWEAQARLGTLYGLSGQAAKATQQFQASISTVDSVRRSIEDVELRVSFLSKAIDFYDDYVDFLVSQGRSDDALKIADLSRARTLLEGVGLDSSKLSAGQQPSITRVASSAKAVLLFYWLGKDRSYLWAASPTGRSGLYALPPQSEIAELVNSYHESLVSRRDVLKNGNIEARKLYDILVRPAKDIISENARVLVLPDGPLHSLNFETLVVPEPTPHFWIEDVSVSDASSLLLLASSRKKASPAHPSLLLIGDPVLADKDYPELQHAAAEIRYVAATFSESHPSILSGPQATPSAYLKSDPSRYSFLHFVAHGTASRTSPLDSAIILSPEANGFKLYARDIITRPLRADLVIISSCFGSGTRTLPGEGLVGLSWAFLHAGAHNVIGALWEVNDNSTPEFMRQIYTELAHGRDPAAALRAAKLSLLHSTGAYQKPYYWAPFQLYTGL